MNPTIIPYRVYPFDVVFYCGKTPHKLKKFLSDYIDNDELDFAFDEIKKNTRGRCQMFGTGQTMIYLSISKTHPDFMPTLAHEVFHAVSFLFTRIGIELTPSSEEVYAYAIGYLVSEIIKTLN